MSCVLSRKESPFGDIYTKIQTQSFLGSGEEGFWVFLPYMGMAVILFNNAKPVVQIANIRQKALCEIW